MTGAGILDYIVAILHLPNEEKGVYGKEGVYPLIPGGYDKC